MPRFFLLLFALSVLAARQPAYGQTWAEKMLNKRSHDFGTVARGASGRCTFVITNPYKETVHIAGVAKSCGCTSATVDRDTLRTHENARLEVVMDTIKFTERKTTSITVTFDRPFYAQVKLRVSAYIRRDVVLSPGSASFGSIDRGKGATRQIDIVYAGRPDWRIEAVHSANRFIQTKLTETRRQGGRVGYRLVVTLKPEAPSGYFRDQLTLVTNDPRSRQLPVLVEGKVEADVTVTPEAVFLGTVRAGQTVTRQIVVRGKKPFRIIGVQALGSAATEAFSVKAPQKSKRLHLVAVTFTAPTKPGKASQNFRIETDLEGGPVLEFSAYAQVVP